MSDIDKDIEKAIENIAKDRAQIHDVIVPAIQYLKDCEENHQSTGSVVAKYFEVLQRSNDQLIKIIGIKQKRERFDDDDFSAEDIFNMIDDTKELDN